MRVVADRDACSGAGQCVLAAPDLFDQDDAEGLVVLLRSPDAVEAETVREAVSLCPSGALHLQE